MSAFRSFIGSSHPVLWVQTSEVWRALGKFAHELSTLKKDYNLLTWDIVNGIRPIGLEDGVLAKGKPLTRTIPSPMPGAPATEEPYNGITAPFQWLEEEAPANTILFLKNYHPYLQKEFEQSPLVIQNILEHRDVGKAVGKTLVILSNQLAIPTDLEHAVTVVPFELPDRDGLRAVLKGVVADAGAKYPIGEESVLDAAQGMSTDQFEDAVALSIVENKGKVVASVVKEAKEAVVRKDNLLEIVNAPVDLSDVGGLEYLKEDLVNVQKCSTEDARAYHCKTPKGMLFVGIPGCGKSLMAKAVASQWGRPLLKLNLGDIMDKYVGGSEANFKKVIEIVKAVSPCILWIDELEKNFSGSGGGSNEGHEVTRRLLGKFLDFLQDRAEGVFVVATANNVVNLPDEMLRSGRFDAIYWVDLPTPAQRAEILDIHLKKVGRALSNFSKEDAMKLIETSDQFSGADIECWVGTAVNHGFLAGHEDPDVSDFMDTLDDIHITDAKSPKLLESRQWAKDHRCKLASKPAESKDKEGLKKNGKRKIVVGEGE